MVITLAIEVGSWDWRMNFPASQQKNNHMVLSEAEQGNLVQNRWRFLMLVLRQGSSHWLISAITLSYEDLSKNHTLFVPQYYPPLITSGICFSTPF